MIDFCGFFVFVAVKSQQLTDGCIICICMCGFILKGLKPFHVTVLKPLPKNDAQ